MLTGPGLKLRTNVTNLAAGTATTPALLTWTSLALVTTLISRFVADSCICPSLASRRMQVRMGMVVLAGTTFATTARAF